MTDIIKQNIINKINEEKDNFYINYAMSNYNIFELCNILFKIKKNKFNYILRNYNSFSKLIHEIYIKDLCDTNSIKYIINYIIKYNNRIFEVDNNFSFFDNYKHLFDESSKSKIENIFKTYIIERGENITTYSFMNIVSYFDNLNNFNNFILNNNIGKYIIVSCETIQTYMNHKEIKIQDIFNDILSLLLIGNYTNNKVFNIISEFLSKVKRYNVNINKEVLKRIYDKYFKYEPNIDYCTYNLGFFINFLNFFNEFFDKQQETYFINRLCDKNEDKIALEAILDLYKFKYDVNKNYVQGLLFLLKLNKQ